MWIPWDLNSLRRQTWWPSVWLFDWYWFSWLLKYLMAYLSCYRSIKLLLSQLFLPSFSVLRPHASLMDKQVCKLRVYTLFKTVQKYLILIYKCWLKSKRQCSITSLIILLSALLFSSADCHVTTHLSFVFQPSLLRNLHIILIYKFNFKI